MPTWQADANAASLRPGARVLVISPHEQVRIVTADRLSIETPDRSRISALVLDRTMGSLTLALPDGQPIRLSRGTADDDGDHAVDRTPFSRQLWVVN